MDSKRLEEIRARKAEIAAAVKDESKKINAEELRAELDALNKEQKEIEERAKIILDVNNDAAETNKINKPEVRNNMSNESNLESIEYRKAFMDYVQTGTMAEEFRASAMTTNNAAVIPTTTLNKIIEKMEQVGNILPLVSKTSYPAGLAIPTANMGITAEWVAESKTAAQQGAGTAAITFGGYKLQARVGVSLDMHVKALSAFETALINNVSRAMVRSLEQAIISGDGSGKPTGIVTESVPSDRKVAVKTFDYKTLVAIESAVPAAYDSTGSLFLNKKTYLKFAAMTDSSGQPIARVNYGTDGKPERSLFGRPVILTEYLPAFDAANGGDVVGFVFDPANYVLNTGYDITMRQYIDEATDDIVTKATMIVDGKTVDNNGLVLITKDAAGK